MIALHSAIDRDPFTAGERGKDTDPSSCSPSAVNRSYALGGGQIINEPESMAV